MSATCSKLNGIMATLNTNVDLAPATVISITVKLQQSLIMFCQVAIDKNFTIPRSDAGSLVNHNLDKLRLLTGARFDMLQPCTGKGVTWSVYFHDQGMSSLLSESCDMLTSLQLLWMQ